MPTKYSKQNIQDIESSINKKAAKYNIFKKWKPLRKFSQNILKYSLATTVSNTAKRWYSDLGKLDKSYALLKSLKDTPKKTTPPKMSSYDASYSADDKKNLNTQLGNFTPNNTPPKQKDTSKAKDNKKS